jgi:putative FmdB family regulatory protein
MPIYEYRCRECGHQFETIQRVGARALRKCPECSGRLEKLISRTSFQLKGGGWYAQGYSDKPPKKKTETAEKKSGDAKSSGKTASG